MSRYVVDASVAAKWFLEEPHTQEALRLLADPHELRAPDLLWLELYSVVCKRIRRKQLPRQKGFRILWGLRRLPIRISPSADLLDLATILSLDTTTSLYDCIYLALAVMQDASVVTADHRFYQSLATGPLRNRLLWIGDIP
ncbi:MAG: type II toxin-antitoxin system VapC family toxin [Terriglobia bacterium]